MDPELRRELDEIHALVKDNHQMLRAIRRSQMLGLIWKVVFWIIVVVAPLYLYQQYVEPMLSKISTSGVSTTTSVLGVPVQTSVDLGKLVNSIKSGQ